MLEVPITISSDQTANNYAFSLEKLPGIVSFFTRPVDEAEVFIDGTSVGMTPLISPEQKQSPDTL